MNEVNEADDVTDIRRNLRFETAAELYKAIPEIAEDVTARPEKHSSVDFIHALTTSQTPEEAITFCAYVLPRRYAVWWGHECLRQVEALLDRHDLAMLDLAATWVAAPEEEARYNALDAAMESKAKSPGVWIALAAGWSSGSMVGPDLPPVPPAPHLTARAVNAGVLSALARVDVSERAEQLARFARMAIKLSEDG